MVEVSFVAGEMVNLMGGVMEVSSSKKKGSGDSGKDVKEAGLLMKAAEMLDLPGEVVAGVARIEITGGREIIIENHGGILEYGPNEIDVNSDGVILRIQGDGLEIRAMTATELSIRGMVLSVEFVY
jgi:sporulation protein YqfC